MKRFLDAGCGSSLQLREIVKRGYEAIGLDSSFSHAKILASKGEIRRNQDRNYKGGPDLFQTEKEGDFAFIMMGTIGYVDSDYRFLTHLDSVADAEGCYAEN